MFKIRFVCFHTSSLHYSSNKNLLSKLRKSTGFSFINCKDALDKFDNDIKKAEKYLKERAQNEGWTKATKLQGRPMSQGLIGIILQNNAASIVEVNCETDFVSRNTQFKNLTTLVCSALHFRGLELSKEKIIYKNEDLLKLEINGNNISNLTALEIGSLGENIAVRRGVFLKAMPKQHISYYIHETGPKIDSSLGLCNYGKYGALVLYSKLEDHESPDEDVIILPPDQVGRELCQHIVGMNPLYIDRKEISDEPIKEEIQTEKINALPETQGEINNEEDGKKIIEENCLLKQEFILNSDITVGQYLQQQGVQVIDFVRLECGEDIVEDKLQQATAV